MTAKLESIPKNKNHISANDGGDNPLIYEAGTNKNLTPNEVQGKGATYDQLTYSDPSLVGYWPFDEGSGITTKDYSGNEHDGILCNGSTFGVQGPTWTTGKVGSALSFDGADDYVRIEDVSALSPTSAFTIAYWYKFNNPLINPVILNKRDGSNHEYQVSIVSGNQLQVCILGTGGGCYYSSLYTEDTNWHYLVATFNDAQNFIRAFRDNILIISVATIATFSDTPAPLFLGGYAGNLGNQYPGLIDEVRIYNRALSDSEIKVLYDATK